MEFSLKKGQIPNPSSPSEVAMDGLNPTPGKAGSWGRTGLPERSRLRDGSHLLPLDQLEGSQELADIPAGFEDGIPGKPGRALQAGTADAAPHEFIRTLGREFQGIGNHGNWDSHPFSQRNPCPPPPAKNQE